MRSRAPNRRKGSGKPSRKASASRRKRSGADIRQYLVRCWWIFRGAAAGTLVLVLLYGTYLGAGKVMELDSLAVKVIEVDGCRSVRPEAIKQRTGVLMGDPLLRVNLRKVRQKIVSHPSVKDATVVRELPDTLRISVRERVSSAAVLGDEFALVDFEGVVMSLHASYPEGFPIITGVVEPLVPGRVIMEVVPAMEVLGAITRSGLIGPEKISEISISGDQIAMSLVGTGTVLVMGRGEAGAQVEKLTRLMEAGVFDARSAGYDLRFNGRVIGMAERTLSEPGASGLSPAGG